jgi:hypothetical protein
VAPILPQLWGFAMKPPIRTKSVGTKVNEAEFALLEESARAAVLSGQRSLRKGLSIP